MAFFQAFTFVFMLKYDWQSLAKVIRNKIGLFPIFLVFHLQVSAQTWQEDSTKGRWPFFNLSQHFGFIIPHAQELKSISRSAVTGVQLEAGYLWTHPSAYRQTNSYARLGLGYQYMDFGNRSVLGQAQNLSVYLEPYLGFRKKIQTAFRFGLGACYLNNVHHPVKNPENQFFSSPISFVTYLALTSRWAFHPNWRLAGSAFYNHISNGGAKMPNKGINYPTASIGIEYCPKGEYFPKPLPRLNGPFPWHIRVEAGFSLKNTPQDWDENPKAVPILNILALLDKQFSAIQRLGIAIELSEDRYTKADFHQKKLNLAHQNAGFGIQHGFVLGKFSLTQAYMVYLFNEKPNHAVAYQRYGIFYHFIPTVYVGGTLKAHRHVADIFDIRLGWQYGWNKKIPV